MFSLLCDEMMIDGLLTGSQWVHWNEAVSIKLRFQSQSQMPFGGLQFFHYLSIEQNALHSRLLTGSFGWRRVRGGIQI